MAQNAWAIFRSQSSLDRLFVNMNFPVRFTIIFRSGVWTLSGSFLTYENSLILAIQ